ncbi:MAG: DpnI domain-containing protein [Tepidisphaeraceae bacterium]|jgi:type II restriction enzyme
MIVTMPISLAVSYKSPAQRARVVTEGWAEQNLFCPACSAERLSPSPRNTRAVDFECCQCKQTFQLKGKSSSFTNKVIDGAYEALMAAVSSDTVPNLFLLHYDRAAWTVANLTLVPYFAFPPSAIECRRPLSPNARRAGWVGCYIVLSRIPAEARIAVVRDGEPIEPQNVREQYQRLLPLTQIVAPERGWTLDVLNMARSIGPSEFTNAEMYARSHELRARHPENRHVTDKIRQQLQILRDAGFLKHVGRGRWRLA